MNMCVLDRLYFGMINVKNNAIIQERWGVNKLLFFSTDEK